MRPVIVVQPSDAFGAEERCLQLASFDRIGYGPKRGCRVAVHGHLVDECLVRTNFLRLKTR
jgi:hypothetical protein